MHIRLPSYDNLTFLFFQCVTPHLQTPSVSIARSHIICKSHPLKSHIKQSCTFVHPHPLQTDIPTVHMCETQQRKVKPHFPHTTPSWSLSLHMMQCFHRMSSQYDRSQTEIQFNQNNSAEIKSTGKYARCIIIILTNLVCKKMPVPYNHIIHMLPLCRVFTSPQLPLF